MSAPVPHGSAHPGAPRPLRVVLVLKTARGGLWTLPQLAALRARGHDVVAVLPPGDGALRRALAERGIDVADSPFDFAIGPRPSTLLGVARLGRLLARLAPDVVLYHLYASALATRLATVARPVARVHMVAGPLHLESAPVRQAERGLARLDDVVVCGSAFTARAYRRLGRPPGRTPVVPYGVDVDRFRPAGPAARARARAELGLAGSTFVVVMVAHVYGPKRLVHRHRGIKGHEVLLAAWARFRARHRDVRLVLVGGGFDAAGERHRAALTATYAALFADGGVTWVETAPDVRPWYAAADLSVSPSWSDNHGAALEAGASGVPSIVSDAGALPEAVGPGAGWVVPRGDVRALAAALTTAERERRAGVLHRRGAAARRHVVARFSARTCAAELARIVEDAAGRRGPGAVEHSIFCEARFLEAPASADPDTSPWGRYTRNGGTARVVARAHPRHAGDVLAPGVRLDRLPYYTGPGGLARRALPLALAVARAVRTADTVVLRLPGVVGSLAGVACRVLGRRYAVEVVGDPREVLATGTLGRVGRLAGPGAAACTRWLVRGADTALYATRHALQQRYPARPGAPVTGMPNVVLPAAAFVAAPPRFDPGNRHVVAVGSQERPYKGHDVLLRAVRHLREHGLDVRATVVGGGRLHSGLVALAAELGLSGVVTFTGTITDPVRLRAVLDSAAVFAMPSRTEGLPRALLEAMARGLPAVGTAVGGVPELLEPDRLVPRDDHVALARSLAALLTCRELWEEQARRNLRVAQEHRVDRLEPRFRHWLRSVPPAGGTRPWTGADRGTVR